MSGQRRIPHEARYVVAAKRQASPAIAELVLLPVRERLDFVAGQYVQVSDPDGRLPPRSYSVANAPRADGRIRLLVTLVPGGPVSGWLGRALGVGEQVLVSGPYGTFTARSPARPVLALAGGSGWAPVIALAEQAAQDRFPQPFMALFSARTARDVLDAERTARWQREHANFRYLRTLTRGAGAPPLGRIPQVLPTLRLDLAALDVYISGPPPLVAACTRAVRTLGAAPGHVHTEEFYSDPEPW